MTGPPAVSVLIATYDRLRYLKSTLRTLYAQTFQDFETLVVDDGSRDGTAAWLRRKAWPRLRLLRLERNAGLSAARNVGLGACRGGAVALLDSDDLWRPRCLERLVERLSSPGVQASFCDFRLVDGRGRRLAGAGYASGPQNALYRAVTGRAFLPFPSTALVRREAFARVGGFDERFLRGAEDSDFFCRLGRAFGPRAFAYVEEPLVLRRTHAAQRVYHDGTPCYRSLDPVWIEKALDLGTFFLKHRSWLEEAPASRAPAAPSRETCASGAPARAGRTRGQRPGR